MFTQVLQSIIFVFRIVKPYKLIFLGISDQKGLIFCTIIEHFIS